MGASDIRLSPMYRDYVKKHVNNLEEVERIAWLGWPSKNFIVEVIESLCPNLKESHFYDILSDDRGPARHWDINESWDDISGYDIAICFRTSMYCDDASHFAKELKKLIQNNFCQENSELMVSYPNADITKITLSTLLTSIVWV